MRNTARRRASLPILVSFLIVLSACTAGSVDAGGRVTGTVPTTSASTLETTGDPHYAPSTTLATTSSTATSSTTLATTSSTATSSTTTTTTLAPLEPPTFESIERINLIREFSGYTSRGLSRWERTVPGVEDVRIVSTGDGSEQPALWVPPSGDGDRPLLVVLHSWSSTYLQHAGIPYAMWAQENGWAVIAPNFRGRNDDPDAIGSDLAVQDVVDAIDWATSKDGVEARRVYAVGYSGGGMMALLLAGRHPDRVSAVATWGPVYDLLDFYLQSRRAGRHYAWDLWRACGGDPTGGGPAEEDCLRRSPMTYLDTAREQGVPIYIGQGIYDSFLSTRQGANAFNHLADPEDRLTTEQVDDIARRRRIPEDLAEPTSTETYFGEGDPTVLFARQSAAVWLVYFRADHEMVYQATLHWFASDPR